MQTLWCNDAKAWREWLNANHASATEIWLEFYRAPVRKKLPENERGPTYEESLDQGLCFGWIDVSVKKLDDERYAQRFVPRKNPRKWTPSNVERLKKLIAENQVVPAGIAAIDPQLLE